MSPRSGRKQSHIAVGIVRAQQNSTKPMNIPVALVHRAFVHFADFTALFGAYLGLAPQALCCCPLRGLLLSASRTAVVRFVDRR